MADGFTEHLFAAAAIAPGDQVLDIGCGQAKGILTARHGLDAEAAFPLLLGAAAGIGAVSGVPTVRADVTGSGARPGPFL